MAMEKRWTVPALGEKRQDGDLKDTGEDGEVFSRDADEALFPPIDLLLCPPNHLPQLFLRPLSLVPKFAHALSKRPYMSSQQN